MDNLPLISVIVPVYKVEEYLDKCVSSIVEQTYTNLEIILVDDGSPDNCPAMCDAWAENDSRIKVIHQENGGLSDARNSGMAIASGKLIAFVDGDDRIAPEMYRLLYDNMIQNNSDIAACGVEMVYDSCTQSKMLTPSGQHVLDAQDAMRAIIEESFLKQPVWYKLYKAELIRDILFAVGKCHEDVLWSYQAIGKAKCVSVFDTPCYCYLQRNSSIMGVPFSVKRLDALDAKLQRLTYVEEKYPELIELTKRELFMFCLWMAQMSEKYLDGAEKAECKKKIRDAFAQVKDASAQTMKERLWISLARLSFDGAVRIRNVLGVGV